MARVKEAKREELIFCSLVLDEQTFKTTSKVTAKMTSTSIIRFINIVYIFDAKIIRLFNNNHL